MVSVTTSSPKPFARAIRLIISQRARCGKKPLLNFCFHANSCSGIFLGDMVVIYDQEHLLADLSELSGNSSG